LLRVLTWFEGQAHSASKLGEGSHPRRAFLYTSVDGIDWRWITEFFLPDDTWNASETTLRFMPDGEMIALTRPHWIGTSRPPYREWQWARIDANFGGPNFIRLPSGGDCSYPGLVWHEDLLWMSYYSSHEGKASIYLARIRLH